MREGPRGLEVLIITSASGKRWVVPKGVIETNLSPGESAVKEAAEEAGVAGRLRAPAIGFYEYRKWGGTCHVEMFVLEVEEVHDDWPEAAQRQRQWCTCEEASELVGHRGLKRLLARLPELREGLRDDG